MIVIIKSTPPYKFKYVNKFISLNDIDGTDAAVMISNKFRILLFLFLVRFMEEISSKWYLKLEYLLLILVRIQSLQQIYKNLPYLVID